MTATLLLHLTICRQLGRRLPVPHNAPLSVEIVTNRGRKITRSALEKDDFKYFLLCCCCLANFWLGYRTPVINTSQIAKNMSDKRLKYYYHLRSWVDISSRGRPLPGGINIPTDTKNCRLDLFFPLHTNLFDASYRSQIFHLLTFFTANCSDLQRPQIMRNQYIFYLCSFKDRQATVSMCAYATFTVRKQLA